jgi:hypothetical protein
MKRILLLGLTVLLLSSLSSVWASEGLLVRYVFDEGSGDTVHDSSDFGDPMDLTIADPGAVKWIAGGGLSVDQPTLLAAEGPATKIIDAVRETKELTVVAWVRHANKTQDGPARIVTISVDTGPRNFLLGQAAEGYQVRLRTSNTAPKPEQDKRIIVPDGVVTDEVSKLVYTFDADGDSTLYLNGKELGSVNIGGDFSTWDDTYTLGLANEHTKDRIWLGEIYLVAIYNKAYTLDTLPAPFAVDAADKLATAWASIKAQR